MTSEPVRPILCVVGARPNLMKVAPLIPALGPAASRPVRLVHTGQHYDFGMNDAFFDDLGIAPPDVNLGVGSASHALQTAEIMTRIEPVLEAERPALVVVVGDVNSTLAAGLVAAKLEIPVAHVEAGLRSFDRTMPEEINRVLTDQVADLLFTTEPSAHTNLTREGIAPERIHFVGNVMIDTLKRNLARAVPPAETLAQAGASEGLSAAPRDYALLTLHRPTNVDDKECLARLLEIVSEIARRLAVVFPVHPRTAARIEAFGLRALLDQPGLLALPPLGYLKALGLMAKARLVLTDSGGMQEETTALGVPCLTLRTTTERPITVDEGTNTVVGNDPARIRAAFEDVLATGGKAGRVPKLWDGRATERIAAVVATWLPKGT